MEAADLTSKFFEELRVIFKGMLLRKDVNSKTLSEFMSKWDIVNHKVKEIISHLHRHCMINESDPLKDKTIVD